MAKNPIGLDFLIAGGVAAETYFFIRISGEAF